MSSFRLAIVIAALLTLAAPATAQITPATNTVFANFGDAYYAAMEPIESGASGQVGIAPESAQERVLPLDPPLADLAGLDTEGTVSFLLCYTGSASISGAPIVLAGQIDVYTELRQGGTVIASGTAEDVVINPMVSKATINAQPAVDAIDPAAGNLEWFIRETGAASGALFIPDCEDGDWSHAELPVAGGGASAPAIEYGNLTGDDVKISDSFSNLTKVFIYNWTADGAPLDVDLGVQVDQGSVRVAVADATGELLNRSFDASEDVEERLEGYEEGDITIRIEYAAFGGNLTLDIVPAEEGGPTDTGTQTSTPTSGSNTESTDAETASDTGTGGNETQGGGEDSPALSGVIVLAVVAGLAVAVRRRW